MLRSIMIVLAAALLIPSTTVRAADGDPDASFAGGYVAVPYPHDFNTLGGLAIQTDDKIVTAGSIADGSPAPGPKSMALARVNLDGTLDTGFGSGGMVETGIPGEAIGVVIQSDGKIVALQIQGGSFKLVRFDDDGSLDTGFGSGGSMTANCGGSATLGRLLVQPDDKLVVAGYDGVDRTCFIRVDAGGTLDPSFGSGGTAIVLGISGLGLARQPDGKLVMAGVVDNTKLALARLEADGTLDGGFGSQGIAVTDPAPDGGGLVGVAIAPNGRIVAVGTISNGGDFTVARYRSNGKLDPSFGTDGIVKTAISGSPVGGIVALQDDGKILVAGQSYSFSPPSSYYYVALARYDVAGTLDPSYASGGVDPGAQSGGLSALLLQRDGKALVGSSGSVLFTTSAATIGRYHALTIGCAATALAGCKTTVAPGGAQLKLTDSALDPKDQWKSKWTGAATTLAEFGDPLATDDYRLCLYDDSNGSAFVSGAILAAGSICSGKPCWKAKGTTGFGYKDSVGSRFGITALKLKAGGDGGAQIQVQGRGGALPLPPMPVALPLRLQLSSDNGTCWEATFSATGLKRNEAERFQGASD